MKRVLVITLLVFSTAMPALAQNLDSKTARDAWRVISRVEHREGIPHGLLHSMSLVETGMGNGGHIMPWPFTVGVNGTGYTSFKTRGAALKHMDKLRRMGFERFNVAVDVRDKHNATPSSAEYFLLDLDGDVYKVGARHYSKRFQKKEEAVTFVRSLLDKGYDNIDIGLMQVNWKWHKKHFPNIAAALDPYKNTDYAVSYLRKHRQTRDWWESVGRYHSGTSKHAKRYIKHVWSMYQKVHRLTPQSG